MMNANYRVGKLSGICRRAFPPRVFTIFEPCPNTYDFDVYRCSLWCHHRLESYCLTLLCAQLAVPRPVACVTWTANLACIALS